MNKRHILGILAFIFCCAQAMAQDSTLASQPQRKDASHEEKKWYDMLSIRGYVQSRYNRLLETNSALRCEQCDASWGGTGGFFLRRVRVILYGNLSKRVYFYIQPDFASSVSSTSLHFGQLRDAYFDVGIDPDSRFRVRIGQSKVPYGFENMQSSQNRLPLDRADGLNSAVANERDLGVFFYWAPSKVRQRFSSLVRDGLKGSGDYGVAALGAYNGQTANRPELNDRPHIVGRLSYPFQIGKQIIEPGIQAYTGTYTIPSSNLLNGVGVAEGNHYLDQRAAASFVLYPQPIGVQAEFNVGRGPEYNPHSDSIEVQNLRGGYATVSWLMRLGNQTLIPYSRIQYYDGGKKHEADARSYKVNELEVGAEWQPFKQFELTAAYVFSSRRFEDHANPNNFQKGRLLRVQAQLNF